ncbi:gfo/Idh/MocA family oxidoreductase [Sinorhizobium terangae]|uniref:Gfo/Idh/MocA family oxidoreductase n=3 Tax=Sinorhizobium terangae TaxID=110322 RepID=A0A6N7LHV4_SINTE|nr:Gfo/Idh/MocA family oxidoreductase [Sinorhizobium terangae]MQX17347.1 gfo/Idh/MocA family oxidoreductase [Sinorhizobium terangae]
MTKVALIDTAHWHVPLYLEALEKAGVDVVGVSDPTEKTGPALAKRFNARSFTTCEELISQVRPGVAFVFGKHIDMRKTANFLLDQDIPIAIEKPCGIRSADVRQLSEKASRKNAFVAIPFIFRLSETMGVFRCAEALGRTDHASFRFIAGPPSRYLQAGNPWMLEREVAGGGPLINIGVHMVDMFRSLSGSEITTVSALSTSHINNLSIEDFIAITLKSASGTIGTIECGYTFPSAPGRQREFTFSVRAGKRFLRSINDGIDVVTGNETGVEQEFLPVEFETDLYYAKFVEHVLEALEKKTPTIADFGDAARVLEVVEAAYTSAAEGGRTIHLSN